MSHARIEEVSDSDMDSDPPEEDIDDLDSDFDERDILKRREPTSGPPKPSSSLINPANIPSRANDPRITTASDGTQFHTTEDDSRYKNFQCIYPVYFDIRRSRKQGREVGKELAVENPMARDIVTACGRLGLETLFEPAKLHPKDWANPGRVKVKVKGGNNKSVKNSTSYFMYCEGRASADMNRTSSLHLNIQIPQSQPHHHRKRNPSPRPRRPTT
jgi:signal recognition particle subunit SRP19